MKRLAPGLGVQQGTHILFSDFSNGGPMWSGTGQREVRKPVTFNPAFAEPPIVMVNVSMLDADHGTNLRTDLATENVTARGFDLVFRTWSDSRIARLRADWTAIGAAPDDEDWDLGQA